MERTQSTAHAVYHTRLALGGHRLVGSSCCVEDDLDARAGSQAAHVRHYLLQPPDEDRINSQAPRILPHPIL